MTAPAAAVDAIAARDESESGNRALVSSSEVATAQRRPRWSPLVVTRLRHNPHAFFAGLKREQGDVARARFGHQNLVLISHPADVQRVLVTDDRDFPRLNVAFKRWRRRPSREPDGVILGPGGDPELRVAFRRALQPTYSRNRIDSYWPEFLGAVDEATARWRDGGAVDLVETVDRITLDLVTRAVFGRSFDMPIGDVVARTRAALAVRTYASSQCYRLADQLRFRRNLKAMSAYDDLVKLMRDELDRRRTNGDGDDVLSRLLEVSEENRLRDEQVMLEALGQLFVGSEPVGSAASWALYRLGVDPGLLIRVQSELDRGRTDPQQLGYLSAVLRETLRLHPPFTLIGRQARVDLELGGLGIRAGDPVVVCPYLVHRDRRWWEEPARFAPDRWLDASPDRPKLSYLPFGAGPRQCQGEHVAWRAAEATVAAILSRWELDPVGPEPRPTALRPLGVTMLAKRRF